MDISKGEKDRLENKLHEAILHKEKNEQYFKDQMEQIEALECKADRLNHGHMDEIKALEFEAYQLNLVCKDRGGS